MLRSIWACKASSAFNAASCKVAPALVQPGKSGKNTLYPSDDFSMMAGK
jgi:hypothetical protein